jgi:hypothetical protein
VKHKSRTTTWWNITYVEIKTPAENVIGNGDGYPGTYTQYPAEMVIAHIGDKFHSDRLSFISIMLDDSGSEDEDLEPFIAGWETIQTGQYSKCGVQFDNTNCKLTSSSRRLGESIKMERKNLQQKAKRQQVREDTQEELYVLDDLIMRDMEEQDERKMAQDYLYPYRLVRKTGPGVSRTRKQDDLFFLICLFRTTREENQWSSHNVKLYCLVSWMLFVFPLLFLRHPSSTYYVVLLCL